MHVFVVFFFSNKIFGMPIFVCDLTGFVQARGQGGLLEAKIRISTSEHVTNNGVGTKLLPLKTNHFILDC